MERKKEIVVRYRCTLRVRCEQRRHDFHRRRFHGRVVKRKSAILIRHRCSLRMRGEKRHYDLM